MLIKLSQLFDVFNGLASSEVELLPSPTEGSVQYLRPSSSLSRTVAGYVDRSTVDEKFIFEAETLFVSTDGEGSHSYAYVSPASFIANSNVAVLKPKIKMSLAQKIYYAQAITANRYLFSYGRKPKGDRLKSIMLPKLDALPDWVNAKDISYFEGAEQSAQKLPTPPLDSSQWQSFRYDEMFDIKKGQRLTKSDMTKGSTPYIGASDSNNGVTAFIGQSSIHSADTISVSYNGSVAEAFYQASPFWATDDVNVLYPKFGMTSAVALFICTLIRKEKFRYNYGRKWHAERMRNSIIKLPVTKKGEPNWSYMENYIKSLPFSSQLH